MRTIHLDLAALAGASSRRLREAGVPITAERGANFAHALALVKPITRRRLYWAARAVLVSDPTQLKAFDSVFFSVFGAREPGPEFEPEDVETGPATEPRAARGQARPRRRGRRDSPVNAVRAGEDVA